MYKLGKEKILFLFKSFCYILNLYLAVLFFNVFFLKKNKQGLIVMGSSNGKYCDENLYELLMFLQKRKENVYYVIDKKSEDLNKIKSVSNKVIYRFSFKANLYAMRSNVMIYDTSYYDIIRCKKKYIKQVKTINVFHGIHGLKKIDKSNATKRLLNDDYIIASSDYEKEIKMEWGFPTDRVFVTGLPRYDKLYKQRGINIEKKVIFYMPTWRPWFNRGFLNPSKEEINKFKNSEYFKHILSLSSSKKVNDYLEEQDYFLEIYIHKLMHKYINNIEITNTNSRIKFLNTDVSVQKKIIDSKILITDYSSVFFDFLFLKKPVILYQFDYDKYYKEIAGSYISKNEINTLLTKNLDELVEAIDFNIKKTEESNADTKALLNKYIKYSDENNCERVYQLIKRNFK